MYMEPVDLFRDTESPHIYDAVSKAFRLVLPPSPNDWVITLVNGYDITRNYTAREKFTKNTHSDFYIRLRCENAGYKETSELVDQINSNNIVRLSGIKYVRNLTVNKQIHEGQLLGKALQNPGYGSVYMDAEYDNLEFQGSNITEYCETFLYVICSPIAVLLFVASLVLFFKKCAIAALVVLCGPVVLTTIITWRRLFYGIKCVCLIPL